MANFTKEIIKWLFAAKIGTIMTSDFSNFSAILLNIKIKEGFMLIA